MRFKYYFTIIFSLIYLSIFAQRSEIGIFGGGAYYIGDLNPSSHFLQTSPAGGVIYRYNFNPRFAVRANFFITRVEGSDAVSKFNPERNLSFRSVINDASVVFEFNFLPFIAGNSKYPFTPYVFAGVTLFHFNPQASLDSSIVDQTGKVLYNSGWYNLQPLGTEGQGTTEYPQRKTYSLTNFAIPFGLGLKFSVFKNTALSLEYGLRRTYTDYLDDVSTTYVDPIALSAENTPVSAALADKTITSNGKQSVNTEGKQRGNSKNKDWYSFFGITLQIRIKFYEEPCPAYNKKGKTFKEYKNRY